jgi:hypothetical protein
MGEAIIIILGNVGAVIVQIASNDNIAFLTVNLALADVLMGAYMLAIASVDMAYSGMFYTIVQHWIHSKACVVLGLLNFASSQVSLLILSILSVARMVSIDKIGGMSLIKSKIWKACIGAWIIAITVGMSYTILLLLLDTGANNNLCITIGISNQYQYLTPLERVYQIMFIGCNLILLGVIVTSMVYIFHAVAKSTRAVRQAGDTANKAHSLRLIKLGRRLLLLLTCNVLSWLPFLCVSILLLLGVPVHEYVVQWIAILGVPICACTDPFLYSIAPLKACIKERRKPKPNSNVTALNYF